MTIRRAIAAFLLLTQSWGFAQNPGSGSPIFARGLEAGRAPDTHLVFDPQTFTRISVPHYDGVPGDNPDPLPSKTFNPGDIPKLANIGVNPATLVPEGLDLEIFPSFALSDELSLKPSLSYSADSTLTRRGLMSYGPPKQWRNHYGELVRLISSQEGSHPESIGPLASGETDPYGRREPLPVALETYFINATGQEVNFYPHPEQGATWISDSGNYRLTRKDPASDGFLLETPTGLDFHFEKYRFYLNDPAEIASLHYRVDQIVDRYGNSIQVNYRAADSIQPTVVSSHAAGNANPFQQIEYTYANDRLDQIRVPKPLVGDPHNVTTAPDNSVRHAYHFYYADQAANFSGMDLHQSALAGSATAAGTQVALEPVYFDTAETITQVSAWVKGDAVAGTAELYLDLSQLEGRSLGPVPDYSRLHDPTLLTLDAGVYFLRLSNGANTYIYRLDVPKPNYRHGDTGPGPVVYRYQLDTENGGYPQDPGFSSQTYPDLLKVASPSGLTHAPGEGVYNLELFPALKAGDTFADQSGNTAILTKSQLDGLTDPEAIETGTHFTGPVRLLRADNLERIAAITFPQSGTGAAFTQRHMVIAYDDWSANHQEIALVTTLDKDQPVRQTQYTYEMVRTLGTHEDSKDRQTPGAPVPDSDFVCTFNTIDWERTGPDRVYVGLEDGGREQEICLLRRKVERFAALPGQDLSSEELVTTYGGAYHVVLAGVTQNDEEPPHEADCRRIQWSLDGKLFDYTWQINPDGSGQVFDLSPDGLDLDPFLKVHGRRSRVFKTYAFDTAFESNFTANFPVESDGTPFFTRMPTYPAASPGVDLETVFADPRVYMTNPPPTMAQVFGSESKCHTATITGFEPVVRYPYALHDHYMGRDSLRIMHGSAKLLVPSGGAPSYPVHFRSSAIRLLVNGLTRDGATPITTPDLASVERFFDGHLSSGLNASFTAGGDSVSLTETVAWQSLPGDRTDLDNGLQPFNNALGRMEMKPSFSYQVRLLKGLTWDASGNRLDLFGAETPMISATRHSTAQLLYEHGPVTANSGVTQLNINLPNTVGVNDVMLMGKLYYRITAVSANQVSFEPGLRGHFGVLDEAKPRFYRYHADGTDFDRYRGYDSFGNNSYKATYAGLTASHFNQNSPDGFLVPDFQEDQAVTLSMDDSTSAANNDRQNWQFFGRVTRQTSSGSEPFYNFHDDTVPTDPVGTDYWFLGTWDYSGSGYPWKPNQEQHAYRPVYLPNASDTDLENASPAAHDEDLRTVFTYFPPAGAALKRGKLKSRKTYKTGDLTHYSQAQYKYNNSGRMTEELTASFKGTAPYGLRTEMVSEGNLGLVMRETHYTGSASSGSTLTVPPDTEQRTNFWDYDHLGREVLSFSQDRMDNPFGPVVTTAYHTPLETHTLITHNDDTTPLSHTRAYSDGLGRAAMTYLQRGTSTSFYATGTTYDLAGRPDKQFLESQRDQLPTFTAQLKVGDALQLSAFTQARYNQRSEPSGTLAQDPDPQWQSFQWQFIRQHPSDGTDVRFDLLEEQGIPGDETGVRVTLKRQQFDRLGRLVDVRDYEHLTGNSVTLTNLQAAEAYLDGILNGQTLEPDSLTLKALANYSFDRHGNVTQAVTGISTLHTRNFLYDQRGRLRQETHPEMDEPVIYGAFEVNDLPGSITYGNASRMETRTYDAYGQMLRATYSDGAETYVDYWTYTDEADPFPGLPETAIAKSDAGGGQWPGIAYRYQYHPLTGLLTEKAMLHNLDNTVTVGYQNIADLETGTPNWNLALTMTMGYDDGAGGRPSSRLGRLISLGYPRASAQEPPGGATDLRFHYDPAEGGLVTAVEDLGLDTFPISNATYGKGDQVVSYDVGVGDGQYRNVTVLDGLNRIQTQGFHLGTAPGSDTPTTWRDYRYDRAQRIDRIKTDGAPHLHYRYDALGQIATAGITVNGNEHNYSFGYDPHGNLTQRTQNGDTENFSYTKNRANDFGYHGAYGEMTSGTRQGEAYTLGYSPKGRMIRFQEVSSGITEDYIYDTYGMRVLVSKSSGEHRLLFYDDGNRALVEWRQSNGEAAHWEHTTIPFNGVTAVTYEYEGSAAMAPPPPIPPDITFTHDTLLHDLALSWTAGTMNPVYHLQLADDHRIPIRNFDGLTKTEIRPKTHLGYGRYHVRVSQQGQPYGPGSP